MYTDWAIVPVNYPPHWTVEAYIICTVCITMPLIQLLIILTDNIPLKGRGGK